MKVTNLGKRLSAPNDNISTESIHPNGGFQNPIQFH